MDLTFLNRLGLVFKNLTCLLKDRNYDTSEMDALVGQCGLETAGRIYVHSKRLGCSLAEATRFTVASKKTYKGIKIWILDRNFDFLKQKERMTSTDQIKSVISEIEADDFNGHIIVCPTKCSPQAKKELPLNSEYFIFDELLIDLPRHVLVSKHTPVSLDAAKSFLGENLIPEDLPRIPRSDPIAKWYDWPQNTLLFIDNPVLPKFRIVV